MNLRKIPNQWQYSPRKYKFHSCAVYFKDEVLFKDPWQSKKEEAEECAKYCNKTHIEIGLFDIPSAEDLLLQCYTFMSVQKARKMHKCFGCDNERKIFEYGYDSDVDDSGELEVCLLYDHIIGCQLDEETLLDWYEYEIFESISSKSIMKFYEKVRQELGLTPVSKQWDVKTFCKSKGFIHKRHPAYENVYYNVYNKLCNSSL